MNGLDWQVFQLPLAAGLNQRFDDRARQPPFLDIAKDVQFDEIGGIQTRKPFADLSANELADARRVYDFGDELLVFTKDSLFSYDSANDEYVNKGTYLAVKVDEEPVSITTGDQTMADRAELDGSIFYVYRDEGNSASYITVVDKATKAVTVPAATLDDYTHARLVALDTVVLLFVVDASTNELAVFAIDPADPVTSLGISNNEVSETPALVAGIDAADRIYDVTRVIGADTAVGAARLDPNTSHLVFKVTSALAVTTSTKARTGAGAIAVSSTPDGASVQVIRADSSTSLRGDLITISSLADTAHIDTDVSGAVSGDVQIGWVTAAHRSVQDGGQFRCYVFWSDSEEFGFTPWSSARNFVDTAGTLGTAAKFVRRLGIASRAFDHDGRVFFWGFFVGQSTFTGANNEDYSARLQNTYFLYRDDGFLCAKAATAHAGGEPVYGHLPGVALTDGTTTYAWAGTERRLVPIGEAGRQEAYADRGPRDIVFTFDSNEARRAVQLGKTLYIAGGEILQYDGTRLTEVGFHIFPWSFLGTVTNTGGLVDGDYTYKATWRWDNARGEVDRSTTATTLTVTVSSGPDKVVFQEFAPLYVTHKTTYPVVVEIWRTAVDPVLDAPFFLATDRDPANTSNPNRHLVNDTSVDQLAQFDDELADSALTVNSTFHEPAGVLENVAPPAASIIMATDTRLFLAGVAGDPNRVWYSLLRGDGEVARFNEALTFDVPTKGGRITAIAELNNGMIIVFRETAVYAFSGQGFSNVGSDDGSQNFQLSQTISTDVGAVSHEAVALTSDGILFKSSKGWMLLGGGGQVQYVGAPISDYDADTVCSVHVLDGRHQVRVLTTSRMLVFDTVARQWSEWTVSDGIHACIWRGTYCYLTSANVKDEQTTYTDLTYGLDVETAWIKPADMQGSVRLRWLLALGEYRSAHDLRLRIAYDYVGTYVDDRTWTVSPTTVGGPEQVRLGPSRQQCQAFKLRITAQAVGSATPPTGEALKLTGLGVELGFRKGLYRRLPVAQKA